MQTTQDRIRDANLALHTAVTRLLADAETLRQRREELLQLVTAATDPQAAEGAEGSPNAR